MNKIGLIKLGINQIINQGLEYISYNFNRQLNLPIRFSLGITEKCEMRCRHCDIWKLKPSRKEISTEKKIKILKEIENWVGPFIVDFYGGEPYLKPEEMRRLSNFCWENNIFTGTNSDGYFIDRKMAKEIARSGLNTIIISLDGVKPNTHNYIRGVNSSYEKAISALSHLNEYRDKMSLGINTVLMGYNMEEIPPLIEFAKKQDVWISIQALQANLKPDVWQDFDPLWYKKSELWPKDISRMNNIIDNIISMKKEEYSIKNSIGELKSYKVYFTSPDNSLSIKCYAGVRNLIVSPYGDYKLCYYMEPVGDIKNGSVKKAWYSEKAKQQRLSIKNCTRHCRMLRCNRKQSLLKQFSTFIEYMLKS